MKESKSRYFNQYFSWSKHNMKKLCSGIRSILNVGKCENSDITSISNNNKSIDNANNIANTVNNFFVNVGKTTEKGIPRGNHSPSFYLKGSYSGLPATSNEIDTFNGDINFSESPGKYSLPVII